MLSEMILMGIYVVQVDFGVSLCCQELILTGIYVVRVDFCGSLCCQS